MDPGDKILMMVAFWGLSAALWGVCYSMLKLGWLRRTFTMHRWATNPFQMYCLFLLLQVSANQIVIGVPETSAQSALDRDAQLWLAAVNLFGAAVSAYGLHLRHLETSLRIELAGYLSLLSTLGIYVYLVISLFPLPNTSYGLAFSEAFVFASLHRAIQIWLHKRGVKRDPHHRCVVCREALFLAGLL